MNPPQTSGASASKLPCPPRELKRSKTASWVVLAMSGFVLTMAISFGNAPRPFVDRMNLFLAPLVAASLGIAAFTALRFRRSCMAYRDAKLANQANPSGRDMPPDA